MGGENSAFWLFLWQSDRLKIGFLWVKNLFLKRKLDFVNHFKKTVLGKPVKEQKQSFIKKRLKRVV